MLKEIIIRLVVVIVEWWLGSSETSNEVKKKWYDFVSSATGDTPISKKYRTKYDEVKAKLESE